MKIFDKLSECEILALSRQRKISAAMLIVSKDSA